MYYLRNWQVTFLLYTLGAKITEYIAKASMEPRDYRVVFLIQKCAHLQDADRRKGIIKSIYMICVFIFEGKICPVGMYSFFGRKLPVKLCRWRPCTTAATSISRRVCQRQGVIPLEDDKRTAALIFSKPPQIKKSILSARKPLSLQRFFSFPVSRGRVIRAI